MSASAFANDSDTRIVDDNGAKDDLSGILDYANKIYACGWSAEAYRIYKKVADLALPLDETKYREITQAYLALDPLTEDIRPFRPLAKIGQNQFFSGLHLTSDLTDYQKRIAFKSAVRKIDVETSTQCNRRCRYCSNSIHDRRSANKFIDDAVFDRLIGDLAEIDYAGRLAFVGHNEPLMHFENLSGRIAAARAKLPHAEIVIFSNGDHLNGDVFTKIEELGVDVLLLTMHMSPEKVYDECDALQRIFDIAKKIHLSPRIDTFIHNVKFEMSLTGSRVKVELRHANMLKYGHSQGGALKDVGEQVHDRTETCLEPYFAFIVGHRGDVHPCSLLVADTPEHESTIVGNLHTASIFDIYCGEKFTAWRRSRITSDPKPQPCASCPTNRTCFGSQLQDTIQEAMEQVDDIDQRNDTAA
jgi:radical SAM protein with 4Fe4S-binding SPASM domain